MTASKRRGSSSKVNRISLLPEEILVEILLRVPADGLVQLRRVSKCCREVINRPDFARDHLSHWRSRSGLACDYSSEIFYVSFDDVGGDGKCSKAKRHELRVDCGELREPLLRDCRDRFHCSWVHLSILDSCDGLLLISGSLIGNCSGQRLLVCNPATRRCRLLPNCYKMLSSFPWNDRNYWRIVYDPSVRSYKVVCVFPECSLICMIGMDQARQPPTSWIWVRARLMLRNGSVKASCSVNGKLHLLLSGEVGSSWKVQLLSINLAAEVVAALDLSPTGSESPAVLLRSNVFGMNGAFYQVKISLPDNIFELWVLKDLDEPVWFSLQEIINMPRPPSGKIWKEFKLLRISEDAQRFFFVSRSSKRWNNMNVFMYEMNTGRWKMILSEGIGLESHKMQVGHVQSLTRWR